ncbi:hypothetical protein H206_03622 [Candidatus Electrothrix aarhusensis]|uniref:Uncharacterized protein n=1 Tax=Candidatus Electrothrix aarhusensis TaxID=1859131 RepID=A0A3S3R0P5_9BACT|nr:hypothetical protein H206_03622 [Candidatus Electrothrix aarhusensis]
MLDDKARLQHILDAILEIEEYMTTHSETDFFSNSMLSSACIRQLEIIGEAAGRISKELRTASPTIRWKEIIGLRNRHYTDLFQPADLTGSCCFANNAKSIG